MTSSIPIWSLPEISRLLSTYRSQSAEKSFSGIDRSLLFFRPWTGLPDHLLFVQDFFQLSFRVLYEKRIALSAFPVYIIMKYFFITGQESNKVSGVENVVSSRVRVLTREGLHGRPASQIATMLAKRKASLTLSRVDDPESKADGSSVLDMLIMAAGFNTDLQLIARGPEAQELLAEVTDFFNNKFGEEEA
jgi:phosphotransferase system HPr (HPr) family protein